MARQNNFFRNLDPLMRLMLFVGVIGAVAAFTLAAYSPPEPEFDQDFVGAVDLGDEGDYIGQGEVQMDMLIVDRQAEATMSIAGGSLCNQDVCLSAGELMFSGPVTVYNNGFRATMTHDVFVVTIYVDGWYGKDMVEVVADGYGQRIIADMRTLTPTHAYFRGSM